MTPVARLGSVSIDCPDPVALAEFYAAVTGFEVAYSTEQFVALAGPAVWLTLHQVAEYRPPTWPDPARPKQLHLDFATDDLERTEAELVALGATPAETQPAPELWRVLLDPVGHPFCITTLIPDP